MSSSSFKTAKPGRLVFKGGEAATLDKHKKKKHKKPKKSEEEAVGVVDEGTQSEAAGGGDGGGEVVYTIDAAKRMQYEELFPVEAKKFKYDPANTSRAKAAATAASRSVEEALDDRVSKKADRYCK